MINCPSCGKEIADDSAHCGFCGQKIESRKQKKKTMFGMAALDGDELKKAVEQAKEAKQSGPGGGGGGMKLPKPGQGGGAKPSTSSGLKIPKPGQKAPAADADDGAGLAKTERIDLSSASLPDEAPQAEAAAAEPAEPELAADGTGFSGQDAFDDSFDDSFGPTNPDGFDSVDEPQDNLGSLVTANEPADRFGPGPEANAPPAQGGFGQQEIDTGAAPAEKKSKTGLIIGIVVAAMLLGGGCMAGIGYYVYTAYF